MASDWALALHGVSKRYPGVQALWDVSLEVRPGEVHAVVGENGSGKSTLLGIASGAIVPDAGRVEIMGQPLREAQPAAARRLGLATVYQDNSLVLDLTVAQNLYLSAPAPERPPFPTMNAWARRIVEAYSLPFSPAATVGDLSVAARQFLEVIKALLTHPQALLMDEPTTALGPADVEKLQSIVREVAAGGTAVVYVSHRLPEVLRLANRVTVLRDGEHQGTFDPHSFIEKDIVALMVGRPVELEFPPKNTRVTDNGSVLTVASLAAEDFGPLDLLVRQGEILGIAGADGNGQREFIRALAGFEIATGHVQVNGRSLRLNSPQRSLRGGIMLLSGDRRRESIFSPLSVRHNMTIQVVNRFGRFGIVGGRGERQAAALLVEELEIVTPSLEQPVEFLSGGNQQKTVVARSFLYPAQVVIVDEPTQGVDVKARLDIYRALRAKAAAGVAVMVNSSDAFELAGLCDRVIVLSRGRVTRVLEGLELTEANVIASFLTSTVQRAETQAARRGTSARAQWRRRLQTVRASQWAPLFLIALLIVGVGAFTHTQSSAFLSLFNMQSLLFSVVPLALVAMAQLHVMLVGGFDISVGSHMSLAVVLASFFMVRNDPLGLVVLGGVGVLGVGLLIGLLNAGLVRGIRIPAVIATIATLSLLQGIALLLRGVPQGPISGEFTAALRATAAFLPYAFLGLIALAIVSDLWLHYRGGGLRVRAVGFREEASRRVGVPTTRIHVRAYLLAGLLAALAGLFLSAQVGVGAPTVGASFTLRSIAAAVLGGALLTGGRGSFVGALLGALLLQLTVNIIPFLEISSAFGNITSGVLTLLAILLYSRAGAWSRMLALLRARRRELAPAATD